MVNPILIAFKFEISKVHFDVVFEVPIYIIPSLLHCLNNTFSEWLGQEICLDVDPAVEYICTNQCNEAILKRILLLGC